MRRLLRATIATAILLVSIGVPAAAMPVPGAGLSNPGAPIVEFGTGANAAVGAGYRAPESRAPTVGYPAPDYDPVAEGFESVPDSFAAIITGQGEAGNVIDLYCIDRFTTTFAGLSYAPNQWSVADEPFIPYIAYILTHYFPAVPGLPALADDNQRVAAVQAAIWYFSDHFLLAPGNPFFAATSAIVTAALANGATTPEPVLPSLAFTGPSTGPSATVLGPYTFQSEATTRGTITYTTGELFLDQAATQPLPSGTEILGGTTFFVRSASPSTVTVAVESSNIPTHTGVVLLYVPADPGAPSPAGAQKLVVAEEETLSRSSELVVEVFQQPPTTTTTTTVPASTTTALASTTTVPGAVAAAGAGASAPGANAAAANVGADTAVPIAELAATGRRVSGLVTLAVTLLLAGGLALLVQRRLRQPVA